MSEEHEEAQCGPEVIVPDAEGTEHRFTLVNTSKGLVLVTTSTLVGLAHGSGQPPHMIQVTPMQPTVPEVSFAPSLSVVESGIAYGEGGDA